MGISVKGLVKSYGSVKVIDDISFEVEGGEFVTLLGPSGCGKTTTLRCIAGLESADGGVISIHGQVVSDAARGVFTPPDERGLGMVFQSYAVWPHLTVAQNVAFPLTVRGQRDTTQAVDWALEVVGMRHLQHRRPSELSGGQQQRVALARAIAARPRVLLFDEPLSNLDARLRDRTRHEISRIQRELKVPALYVTHDQTEALSMSDRVIVLQSGRIEQQGLPQDLYHRPVSRFVAEFIGNACFFEVRPVQGRWQLADGTALRLPADAPPAGDGAAPMLAMVRQELLHLQPAGAAPAAGGPGAPDNVLHGTVRDRMYLGPHVEVGVDVAGTTVRALSRQALEPGSAVQLDFAASDCRLIPLAAADPSLGVPDVR